MLLIRNEKKRLKDKKQQTFVCRRTSISMTAITTVDFARRCHNWIYH